MWVVLLRHPLKTNITIFGVTLAFNCIRILLQFSVFPVRETVEISWLLYFQNRLSGIKLIAYATLSRLTEYEIYYISRWSVCLLQLVRTLLNVLLLRNFKNYLSLSLSMHLLRRMNVMLDFIWTLPVQLRGTWNKWILQKHLIHCRIRTLTTQGNHPVSPPHLPLGNNSIVIKQKIKCPSNVC